MCYDEMHEKYEAMTHEELMKKHIEIEVGLQTQQSIYFRSL